MMSELTYKTYVYRNDETYALELLLGSDYTTLLDLMPEDEFYIVTDGDAIRIVPFGTDDAFEESIEQEWCVQVSNESTITIGANALSVLQCVLGDEFRIRLGRCEIKLVKSSRVENIQNQIELASKGNKQQRQQAFRFIREQIATNTASDSELKLYSQSSLAKIRRMVACSAGINNETLSRLQCDDDIRVADAALTLRRTSPAVRSLSDRAVLELIRSLDICSEDLDILSNSANRDFRLAIAQCSNASEVTLSHLADDPDADVREEALKRLGYEIPKWTMSFLKGSLNPRQTITNRPSLFVAVLSPGGVYFSPESLKSLMSEHDTDKKSGLDDLGSWEVCKPPRYDIDCLLSGNKLPGLSITNQKRMIIDVTSFREAGHSSSHCLSIASHLDCMFSIDVNSTSISQCTCDKETLFEFVESAPNGSFIELIELRCQKSSEISVYGMGVELDVFELTKEQYESIKQTGDFELVDSLEWDLVDIGQYSLAEDFCVYIDDAEIDIECEYDKRASHGAIDSVNYSERTDRLTKLGKFYAIRAWENKGRWYACQFDGFFRPRCFDIEKVSVLLGEGDSAITIELYSFKYQAETCLIDCSSNGKGVAKYLVNSLGEVSEI